MTNLQTISDEVKEASGPGTPQEIAQREAAEATHRPASDFKASGLVLPRYFSRKRGSGFPLTLPAAVKKDVFLNALLEVPVAKPPRRSPVEWAGAMSVHLVILGALIIVPLYTHRNNSCTRLRSSAIDCPRTAPAACTSRSCDGSTRCKPAENRADVQVTSTYSSDGDSEEGLLGRRVRPAT
jgi:hypothetical protein